MGATEADREKAREILDTAPLLDLGSAIAEALAAEREAARAPFLALAEEFAREGHRLASQSDLYSAGRGDARMADAERLMGAAQ